MTFRSSGFKYFLILWMGVSQQMLGPLPLVPKCISDFREVFIQEPFISRPTGFPSALIHGAYLRSRISQSVGTSPENR